MSTPTSLSGVDDDGAKRVLILLGANRNGLTIKELGTHVDTIAWLLGRGLVHSPELDGMRPLPTVPGNFAHQLTWRPTQKAIDMVEAYERSVWPDFVPMTDKDETAPMWSHWLDKKGMSGALEQVQGDPRVKWNERLQQAIALYRTAETAVDALMRQIGV